MSDITNDIIVGISTAFAEGAISIVRLSGFGSIELVNKIFKGKDLTKVDSHTINYGKIIDNKGEFLDEVLVSVFKAPKTYTKEDVVEINCHGGIFVTNQIYECIILNGARPATPGEFTKRAFLNGRIDLTKAEAVMDMIQAENKSATKLAGKALQGYIKDRIVELRDKLIDISATIQVNIDYPEYDDVEQLTTEKIAPRIKDLLSEVTNILDNSKSAKYIKNGIDTAIVGKPNVGKSSLLNALLEEQKAIVTNIPGTTRDTIEGKINLGSVTLNLIDTAGIRRTDDVVEKIGVEKSIKAIEKAELVLHVIDGNVPLTKEDFDLMKSLENKNSLTIVNKEDLGINIDINLLKDPLIISANDQSKVNKLKNYIEKMMLKFNLSNKDVTYLSNARQIEKMNKAKNELLEACKEIEEQAFIDFVDIHLQAAWLYLGEIIGESSTDSYLDELFSKFCLGK